MYNFYSFTEDPEWFLRKFLDKTTVDIFNLHNHKSIGTLINILKSPKYSKTRSNFEYVKQFFFKLMAFSSKIHHYSQEGSEGQEMRAFFREP